MPGILAKAQSLLLGAKIVSVGYTHLDDEDDTIWPAILLDNGTMLIASCDDEGNHPGSVFIEPEDGEGTTLCRTYTR